MGRPLDERPQGRERPGMPAMLQVTVKTSQRYMARGFSVLLPKGKATVGLVGPAMTSHFWKALSKSCLMRARTFWACR